MIHAKLALPSIFAAILGSYLGAKAAIEFLSHTFYNSLPKEKRSTPEIYFAGTNMSSVYLQHLIQAIQQLVIQCTSLSQLHHYIHYDEQNLFKTQIMYQDYCTSFVYQLARRCEDDAGFAKLIDCMRRAFLNPYLVKYGKDSSNYVEAATAYDGRLEKLHDSYVK